MVRKLEKIFKKRYKLQLIGLAVCIVIILMIGVIKWNTTPPSRSKDITKQMTSINRGKAKDVTDCSRIEFKSGVYQFYGKKERMCYTFSKEDEIRLQKIAYSEARSEGVECMALVMLVVLNRVHSDEFPNTIEEVIFQPIQFTPVLNGTYAIAEPDEATAAALELVMSGWDRSEGSLYFETCKGESWHSRNLTLLFSEGKMRFYK